MASRAMNTLQLDKIKHPFGVEEKVKQGFFESLELAFMSVPFLNITDPYKPFVLNFQCSDFDLGHVLSQCCEKNRKLHPVTYLYQALILAERNNNMLDKELLTIITSLNVWRFLSAFWSERLAQEESNNDISYIGI